MATIIMEFIWKALYCLTLIPFGQTAYYCPSDTSIYGRVCSIFRDKCRTDQDCTVLGHGCAFVPTCGKECFNLARPRVCPKPPPFEVCVTGSINPSCSTDEDCASQDKICCQSGPCHVKRCVYPPRYGRPNPGVCPLPDGICTTTQQKSNCIRDTDCKGGQKCCKSTCGMLQCKNPILIRPNCPAVACIQFGYGCKSDIDCEIGKLCCYDPICGRSCQKPIYPG